MLSKDAETNMNATYGQRPQTSLPNPGAQLLGALAKGTSGTPKGPEHKIKSGAISATIWNNEQDTPNGKISYKTVSFERHYKDKNGNWQNTNKLRSQDIPRAVLVLNKAYEYLALGEDTDTQHI
jgi:hypothetical protein